MQPEKVKIETRKNTMIVGIVDGKIAISVEYTGRGTGYIELNLSEVTRLYDWLFKAQTYLNNQTKG